MRLHHPIAALALAALSLPALAGAATLTEREAAFAKTVAAKDLPAFLAFWTDDGAVFPPGAPIASGKDAIRREWSGLFEDPRTSLEWTPVREEIAGSGDLGYTFGTYAMTRRNEDGSVASRRTGKYLTIWRKGKDGVWRVVADIGSPDPAEGK